MEALVFSPKEEGLSYDTVRNLVHRHILRTTVQALIGAEWKRLQLALSDADLRESKCEQQVTKKIGTPLGKIRIEMPNGRDLKFRSCILCASQRELNIPVEKLLVLPFVDDEGSLRKGMIEIFGENMPSDLVKLFVTSLSELLQCDQDGKLEQRYARGYFGSHNVLGRPGDEGGGLVDYCILRNSRGHHFVAGIWDPLGGEERRWRDIAFALKKRGVKIMDEIITDGSSGAFNLEREFKEEINTEKKEEVSDTKIEPRTKLWEGRKSDPLFDPPEVEQTFIMPMPEPRVDMGAANDEVARFSLAREVLVAVSGALVLTLIVVLGYQYTANSVDFNRLINVNNFAFLSANRAPNDAAGVSPKSAALISAIESNGELDDPAIRNALLSLSEHRDYRVRIAVIRALASNESEASSDRVQFLAKMLEDSDYLVRGFAAKTLGQVGNPQALNVLRARIAKEENKVVLAIINKLLKS